MEQNLGFIGIGAMGEALLKSFIAGGVAEAGRVTASDSNPRRLEAVENKYGIKTTSDNRSVAREASIVLLCVKPQNIREVMEEVGPSLTEDKLLVSIAAGVTTNSLEGYLGRPVPVIRVMPNIACTVGAGMMAVCRGRFATPEDEAVTSRLLKTCGRVLSVKEELMDAVTGLSGSGPAFIFEIIDALASGGVRVGFSRQEALLLAAQTLLGAAKMVLETGDSPTRLRDQVTSPGGTTIAGLHALYRVPVQAALIDAVVAATARAQELGSQVPADDV